MVVAQFYDDSIANSSFACVDPRSKICFLTSEINDELNLFKRVGQQQQQQKSTRSRSARTSQYFYNSLVVEIVSSRVEELEFEIKYNFFKIDMSVVTSLSSSSSSSDSSNSTVSANSEKLFSSSKRNCDFRCFKPESLSAESPNGNNSKSSIRSPVRVCLDESLVCDGELHCMFNNLDEINCKSCFSILF